VISIKTRQTAVFNSLIPQGNLQYTWSSHKTDMLQYLDGWKKLKDKHKAFVETKFWKLTRMLQICITVKHITEVKMQSSEKSLSKKATIYN